MNTQPLSGDGVQGSMHNPSLGLASRDASALNEVAMLRETILQMRAELDVLRNMPSNAKRVPVNPPSKYDGKVEDESARQWVNEVRDSVGLLELRHSFTNEREKILYAANSLTGHAKEAWAVQRRALERQATEALTEQERSAIEQGLTRRVPYLDRAQV